MPPYPQQKKNKKITDSWLVHFLVHFEHRKTADNIIKREGKSRNGARAERKERESECAFYRLETGLEEEQTDNPSASWERPGVAGWLVAEMRIALSRAFTSPLTSPVLSFSQWMASGRPGASGPPAAPSAPTGAGGSARPRHRKTGARTARGWCCSPRTAPTGSACRVSASGLGWVRVQKNLQ